ncbi:MAG: ABC transporter permease subunit [Rhodospirillales bacterium]|jgi:putative lysine/arginine/ornithine/histidine/octopine transport system permease protein|nr:ABC transporter permease subunit [Rhodospirillales bacterium]
METVLPYANLFLTGTAITLLVTLAVLPIGICLGLIGAAAKLSGDPVAMAYANVYTSVVRGLPELLVILVIFMGGQQAVNAVADLVGYEDHIDFDAFTAGVIALAFMFGAYATEIFRGAILAIPKGQTEAAHAFGMGGWLTFRRITLPQVWRLALPGLGNLTLVLMKDSALLSLIGLNEIIRVVGIAAQATKNATLFYFVGALMFLFLTFITMTIQKRLEIRANRGVARARG